MVYLSVKIIANILQSPFCVWKANQWNRKHNAFLVLSIIYKSFPCHVPFVFVFCNDWLSCLLILIMLMKYLGAFFKSWVYESSHFFFYYIIYYRKQPLELHNIELDIRGARNREIEFMNCAREEVSIPRSVIILVNIKSWYWL